MSALQKFFAGGVAHHAYLLIGHPRLVRRGLEDYLSGVMGLELAQNPDVYFKIFDVFGIEASRELKAAAGKKSFTGQKKIFILEVNFITREAQNALLKTFEEPGQGVLFFLLARRSDIFLPTLRSRCEVLTVDLAEDANQLSAEVDLAQTFIKMSPVERLAQVDQLIKNKEGLKQETMKLLDGLEQILYQQGVHDNVDVLRRVIIARRQLYSSGGYPKMILQDLAFAIK